MATSRRLRFVRVLLAWQLAVVLALALFDELTLEVFFGASVMGLLVVLEATGPATVSPPWRESMRWLLLAGLVGFGLVVVRRMIAMLPPGVI